MLGRRAGAKERVQRLNAWLSRRYEGRDRYGVAVEVKGARGRVRASMVGRGQATGTAIGAAAMVRALAEAEVDQAGDLAGGGSRGAGVVLRTPGDPWPLANGRNTRRLAPRWARQGWWVSQVRKGRAAPYPISRDAIAGCDRAKSSTSPSVKRGLGIPRRQPALAPLHRTARTRRGRERAQRGVLRRGFACAILCARKGDCGEFGERAAMARRSREGKTVRRTSGAGKARAGSPGHASHAGVDYGLTMACGEEARPRVGQLDNSIGRDAIAGLRAARKTRNYHRPSEQYGRRDHG